MSDQLLMQEDLGKKYSETWDVFMSNQKVPYVMDEEEYAVFEEAVTKGMKGVISFEWGMINTAFFISSFRTSRKIKPQEGFKPLALEEEYRPISPERYEKIRKEIYAKIGKAS